MLFRSERSDVHHGRRGYIVNIYMIKINNSIIYIDGTVFELHFKLRYIAPVDNSLSGST